MLRGERAHHEQALLEVLRGHLQAAQLLGPHLRQPGQHGRHARTAQRLLAGPDARRRIGGQRGALQHQQTRGVQPLRGQPRHERPVRRVDQHQRAGARMHAATSAGSSSRHSPCPACGCSTSTSAPTGHPPPGSTASSAAWPVGRVAPALRASSSARQTAPAPRASGAAEAGRARDRAREEAGDNAGDGMAQAGNRPRQRGVKAVLNTVRINSIDGFRGLANPVPDPALRRGMVQGGVPGIRSAGRSAQRNQGGGQRPGDIRGAECPAGLIPPTRTVRQGSGRPAQSSPGISHQLRFLYAAHSG